MSDELFEMDEPTSANQLNPRHFAVLLILSRIAEVKQRIKENDEDRDPSNYFRSQIWVWLERTREELQDAITYLQNKVEPDDS